MNSILSLLIDLLFIGLGTFAVWAITRRFTYDEGYEDGFRDGVEDTAYSVARTCQPSEVISRGTTTDGLPSVELRLLGENEQNRAETLRKIREVISSNDNHAA